MERAGQRSRGVHLEMTMKHNVLLRIASLLSILFGTFHLTQDVLRQAEGAVRVPGTVLILVVWVCGTLMLSDRVWGQIIMLVGGVFAAGMIFIHSPGGVVGKSGGFFFIWTLLALSITGWLSVILAARELWMTFRARRSRVPAS
jgi:TRAP-type C4-dicarboxylate transport system permease small subunit